MKVLVIDHYALEPLNQVLYRRLSESGRIRTRIIIPAVWNDSYRLREGAAVRYSADCEVVPLPVIFPTRTHRLIYRGLAQQVKEFSPDVLYMNSEPENFQTYECARILRRFPGVRLVFSTWRNIDYSDGRYPYKFSFLHHWIEKQVLAVAAHGIAFNDSAVPIFKKLGFDRMSVIPPEIDTGLFSPGTREADRPFTIGYAGRIEEQKGIDVLIRAVAGMSPDVRLRIVGSGSASQELRKIGEEAGIAARTDWVPAVMRPGMPAEYQRMDALVLPSLTGRYWKEQFGRVLMEAMACGVPVVGSDSGEIPEVVGGAGMIVHEGDSEGLRRALERLKADASLRRDLIDRGLRRVRERHALERVVPMYRNLLLHMKEGPAL